MEQIQRPIYEAQLISKVQRIIDHGVSYGVDEKLQKKWVKSLWMRNKS